MFTPSSTSSSAIQGSDVDLSFNEGSEEVLEDSEDELVMKTRVSSSDEDSDGGKEEVEAMGMCI